MRGPRGGRQRINRPAGHKGSPQTKTPIAGTGWSRHNCRNHSPRRPPRQPKLRCQQIQQRPSCLTQPPRPHLQAGPCWPVLHKALTQRRLAADRLLRSSDTSTDEE
ncbi:hypothetical protein NDU88_010800 [Pleurodeles waltl]|uniref:Uncharacterized protein n=1 Tax=Pleurodeles waltl TaxID=8319 RepID=A0AAV7QYC7_PLEWA|nr:hypothetical protein NDU88_010800 [Pleurodeles waltl]